MSSFFPPSASFCRVPRVESSFLQTLKEGWMPFRVIANRLRWKKWRANTFLLVIFSVNLKRKLCKECLYEAVTFESQSSKICMLEVCNAYPCYRSHSLLPNSIAVYFFRVCSGALCSVTEPVNLRDAFPEFFFKFASFQWNGFRHTLSKTPKILRSFPVGRPTLVARRSARPCPRSTGGKVAATWSHPTRKRPTENKRWCWPTSGTPATSPVSPARLWVK